MSEHEPETVEDEEQPAEDGNPWAKTSSGDAEDVTDDDDGRAPAKVGAGGFEPSVRARPWRAKADYATCLKR